MKRKIKDDINYGYFDSLVYAAVDYLKEHKTASIDAAINYIIDNKLYTDDNEEEILELVYRYMSTDEIIRRIEKYLKEDLYYTIEDEYYDEIKESRKSLEEKLNDELMAYHVDFDEVIKKGNKYIIKNVNHDDLEDIADFIKWDVDSKLEVQLPIDSDNNDIIVYYKEK